ncbi:MAG: 3-oxoadipate enol-lactonase [Deltaproteobacteria bacterium]|nr:3-oxoadipate enol-lactonase [Deltaproteobacteria bacterium]
MKVTANGIGIHCTLEGSESAPVITLSHSLSTNLTMWEPQMETLLRSHRVLRYDTRGHGGTDGSEGPYTLEMLAEDLRALLHVLGIPKTHFMGISMGGMIGQVLALKAPEMLRSLILCDTSSEIPKDAGPIWEDRIRTAETRGMEAHVPATIERWFTTGFRKARPEVIAGVSSMIRETSPRGYIGCAHAIRRLNLTDRLSRIKVPTLIVVGEEDPGTPVSASRTIHEKIADSELIILKSASHLSNIEQAEAFNRTVSDFLDGIEAK